MLSLVSLLVAFPPSQKKIRFVFNCTVGISTSVLGMNPQLQFYWIYATYFSHGLHLFLQPTYHCRLRLRIHWHASQRQHPPIDVGASDVLHHRYQGQRDPRLPWQPNRRGKNHKHYQISKRFRESIESFICNCTLCAYHDMLCASNLTCAYLIFPFAATLSTYAFKYK